MDPAGGIMTGSTHSGRRTQSRRDGRDMMDRLSVMLGRARHISATEGKVTLLRRALRRVRGLFFRHETYYLYEFPVEDERVLTEADCTPRLDGLTFKMVSSNREADELEALGFDFRSQTIHARQRLDMGAIAFCFFVGPELAHIAWVAMTEEAQRGLTYLPVKVDYARGEAYRGGAWTDPRYRRRGLHVYSRLKRNRFLEERGGVRYRGAVDTSNTASLMGVTKVGSRRYGRGRYLKVLWWSSWRETPMA